jgi:hypothetical protein
MSGKLIIPKPCSENWNQMTPAEKGRHCAVCSKVVKDFTQMETAEIIATLQTSKEEVCGRIDMQQLTPVNTTQKFYFFMKGKFLPKVGYAALALFGLVSLFKKSVYGQTDNHQHIAGGLSYQPEAKDEKQVNIEVVDESNRPVPNAAVNIYTGEVLLNTLYTNQNGSLQTQIEMQGSGYSTLRLEVTAENYLTKVIDGMRITKNGQTIRIKLDEHVIMMGKMIIHEPVEWTPEIKDTIKTRESIDHEKVEMDDSQINKIDPVFPVDPLNREVTNPVLDDPAVQPDFIAFPNPTLGEFTLETQQEAYFDVKIFNELGSLVRTVTNQYRRCSVLLTGQPAGTYYAVLLVGDKAIETHKIVLIK